MNSEFYILNNNYLVPHIIVLLIFFGHLIFFKNPPNLIEIIFAILFLILFFFLVCYFIWNKYGREYSKEEVGYNQKYEFSKPYKDDPVLANYFIEGNLSSNWFSSGILYLIWKKVYSFEKINSKDHLIKCNSKSKDDIQNYPIYVQKIYAFLNIYFVDNKLDLLDFQKKIESLDYIAKGNSFNIKVYSRGLHINKDYLDFVKLYKSVSKEYYNIFHKDEFFIKEGYIIFKYFLILFTIFSIFFAFSLNTFNIFLISVIIVGMFYYNASPIIIFGKFTKKGLLRNLRWHAYKNQLTDHSNIKKHPLTHVILWDEYLVYATAFGIAKNVSSSLDIGYEITEKMKANIF